MDISYNIKQKQFKVYILFFVKIAMKLIKSASENL